MLLRCLELRNPITRFITRLQQQASQGYNNEYNPLNDEISSKEWEGVQQLVDFLQAPVEITKRLEGNNSASSFGQTIAINLMFLTSSKSHKRQKRTSQLEEYFNDLREDLTNASKQQLALLHDP
ncbi:hypothetical protein G6011_03932 [Alternaria panax]|uniref:Uncharacterized protein n=1 Tax=Alternaria panax TaxID=48097 RepID=A0AAD4NTE5_9PLEO|nr:hypothetical protein G6011_03932 [Alternaria panax]